MPVAVRLLCGNRKYGIVYATFEEFLWQKKI